MLFSELLDGKNDIINRQPNNFSYSDYLAMISHYLYSNNREHLPYSDIAVRLINELVEQENPYHANDGDNILLNIFQDLNNIPFPSVENPEFQFVDLFAGIGGFRLAFQNLGGECVFSSEWDKDAQKTYQKNFGDMPFGDITKRSIKNCIPEHFDVLCAGFPCQAFSIAGLQRGFDDARGTLFFDVATILRERRPRAFFLENVKNLQGHDKGKTFEVIYNTLTNDLGYHVFYKVLNSKTHGNVPQNRERIFIVGFDPEQVPNFLDFHFPESIPLNRTIHDIIDQTINEKSLFYTAEKFTHYDELKRCMINPDTIYQWRRQYVRENQNNVCPTLTANMGEGGHNVPLIVTDDHRFRKLSPEECLRFQGYPNNYQFANIANCKKYKQKILDLNNNEGYYYCWRYWGTYISSLSYN